MSHKKRSFFINLVVCFTSCFIVSRFAWCQSIEPLASVTLDKGTLQVYSSMIKPFGLDGRDQLFRFGAPPHIESQVSALSFGPWEETRVRGLGREEFVLGFLYRNEKGELPAGQLRLITSYRATLEDGSEARYWPSGKENPFNEISNYEWNYQLAPLIVEVPKGTRNVKKLEGAIVTLPQDVSTISLSQKDIKSKSAAYGRQVVVIAGDVKKDGNGLIYELLVCRAPKKLTKGKETMKVGGRTNDRKNLVQKGAESSLAFTGIASTGEKVAPNGQFMASINDATRRKVVADLKANRGDNAPSGVLEDAVLNTLTDPNASFTVVRLTFLREKAEFDAIEVTSRESTGDPSFQTFVLENVPLGKAIDEDEINAFVSKQPVEQLVLESPLKPRKWQDLTGKFTVTAKLVNVKDGTVSLEKEDGSVIEVPVSKLSEADQQYLEIESKK